MLQLSRLVLLNQDMHQVVGRPMILGLTHVACGQLVNTDLFRSPLTIGNVHFTQTMQMPQDILHLNVFNQGLIGTNRMLRVWIN